MNAMSDGSSVEIEIQKTLFSIHEVTSKIKTELAMINHLIKGNGQLHETVIDANKKLTTLANNIGINVDNVLSCNGEDNELQFNLKNGLTASAFQEKINECLEDV